ncbi:MAG: chloride channel protein [Aestuariivirgaceae bacterium]
MDGLKASIIGFLSERTVPSVRTLLSTRQPLVWLLALTIGTIGAYAILLFRWLIGQVQWLWLGHDGENYLATFASFREPWVIMASLIGGGLVVGLILRFATVSHRTHGIADVIEARAIHGSNIPLKRGRTSAFVSAISLGAGASAGREGPAVHLGATIASFLERQFNLPAAARRVLLACGAAAAVSASFNAPIAGVLFAHEVILAHYALSAFVPTVIAAVIATLITRVHLGDFPAFIVPEYHIASYWEFPAFALLGIVCGLVAVGFLLSAMATDWASQRINLPVWLRPVLGGALVGSIAIFVPEVIGVGYDATNQALREKYTLVFLFVLLFAKTAATAITLASRFGGGVFSPSLYLGAMAGGAFGIIAASVFPAYASSYGVYAILGMGAVAGAVLGAPISTAMIVFELTGGYEMTIALLLSVSISSMIMQALIGQSFFGWQLSTRGLYLGDGPHRRIMRTWKVAEFMTDLTPEDAGGPAELAPDDLRLTPEDTLEVALRAFDSTGDTRIAVFDPNDMARQIGWADYTKAVTTFNAALIEANVEEHR